MGYKWSLAHSVVSAVLHGRTFSHLSKWVDIHKGSVAGDGRKGGRALKFCSGVRKEGSVEMTELVEKAMAFPTTVPLFWRCQFCLLLYHITLLLDVYVENRFAVSRG